MCLVLPAGLDADTRDLVAKFDQRLDNIGALQGAQCLRFRNGPGFCTYLATRSLLHTTWTAWAQAGAPLWDQACWIAPGFEVVSLAIFDMFPYTSHAATWA